MTQEKKKSSRKEPQPLSLTDKIQSCFWMYFMFISVSIISLVLEALIVNWNILMISLKQAPVKFRFCLFKRKSKMHK